MRLFPLTLCALLFAVPAKADKFWLSDPEAEKNAAAGSSPNIIEGVLLAEDDEGYHVRVVGGEVILAKKSVFRVEKDNMSLDNIVKAEKDAAAANEAAEAERRMAQAAARRDSSARAVEAAVSRGDNRRAVNAAASNEPEFDPVVGAVPGASQADLLRDAQIAWTLTKDRRYLKALRQLRRLR